MRARSPLHGIFNSQFEHTNRIDANRSRDITCRRSRIVWLPLMGFLIMSIRVGFALVGLVTGNRPASRVFRTFVASSALLPVPAPALAYPSSVVFSPNGEAKPLGTVGLLAYGAINLAPKVTPSSSWFGVQAGLLPQWNYGESGVSFGGLEAGFDVITPFDTSDAAIVKPVLNVKLGAITEGIYTPSVSVGLMEVSPDQASMDFTYLAATKTLRASPDATSYGRLTLGYGLNAGNRAEFNGTLPFHNSRSALLVAYETPLIASRLGFVLDYLGGTSEISDTYVGAVLNITNTTAFGVGAFFANDRADSPSDGVFFDLAETFDVTKLAEKP